MEKIYLFFWKIKIFFIEEIKQIALNGWVRRKLPKGRRRRTLVPLRRNDLAWISCSISSSSTRMSSSIIIITTIISNSSSMDVVEIRWLMRVVISLICRSVRPIR